MRSWLPERARRPMLLGTIILTCTLALWACSDAIAPPSTPAGGPQLSLAAGYGTGRAVVIQSLLDTDRCISVSESRREPAAPVISSTCPGTLNQQYVWDASGYIRAFGGENWCLTSDHGYAAQGHAVVLWVCNDGPAQRWEPTADGLYIRQVGTNYCMTIAYPMDEDGVRILLWDCNGGPNQRWEVRAVPTAGALASAFGSGRPVALRSSLTADRCVDVYGYSTTPGANVVSWTCNGTVNQQWTWGRDGRLRTYSHGVERCLESWGGTMQHGERVSINACGTGANQRWVPSPDGTQVMLQGTNVCLQIEGASTGVGVGLQVGTCASSGSAHQRWEARAPDHATCALSLTAVVTDEDALLAAYGVPTTTDTLRLCETWTGSDYVVRETAAGSAWNAWQDADSAETVTYSNGQIAGYAADGGNVHTPVPAGPTLFDFMQADAATRQASYDDPYHAVYASDWSGCGELDCSIQRPAGVASPSVQVVATAGANTGRGAGKFAKHRLKRRGVRALVDEAQEIGRSAQGHRRFRKQRGNAEVVLTLDATTELLIGEETTTSEGTTKATHRWKRGKNGRDHVRERTEIEYTEMIGGRPLRSRTTIELLDVTLNVRPGSGDAPSSTPSISTPRVPR